MYICICQAITESMIQTELKNGCSSIQDLQNRLGVALRCGQCEQEVIALIEAFNKNKHENIFN